MKRRVLTAVLAGILFASCGTANITTNDLATTLPIETSIDLTKVTNDKVPVTINPGRFTIDNVVYHIPKTVPGTYQLDLTQDGTTDAPNNAFFYKSYEELVVGDNRMINNGGVIEDDEDGNMNPIPLGRVITPGAANSAESARFFDSPVFTEAYHTAHGDCDLAVDPTDCAHWDPGANAGAVLCHSLDFSGTRPTGKAKQSQSACSVESSRSARG